MNKSFVAIRSRGVAGRAGWLLALLLTAGCGGGGDGPDMHPVFGSVTLDGQPLDEGRILFRKTAGDQKAFAGEIHDGEYEVVAESGEMKVEITASRLIPGKFDNSNGTPEPVGEMYIPREYNAETTLTANVVADGSNEIPFSLSSK